MMPMTPTHLTAAALNLTPSETAEWRYIYHERIGMMVGAAVDVPDWCKRQAREEADRHIQALREHEIAERLGVIEENK
jgi:hypothetical protein